MRKPISFFILHFLFAALCFSQSPKSTPKLVIGIVVDQMRYDYLDKYWNKYGNDGFKRLVNEGFFCRNTNFNYVPTYTAPGHASIYTGTTPSVHGIIANDWYDRKKGKSVYCTGSKKDTTIGSISTAGQMSPHHLLTTTVTDELMVSSDKRSKVIGIALKDRGAILPAGHMAYAAYWYDSKSGNWISSSYYMKELPQWLNNFNKKELAKEYLAKPWETLLPIAEYTESLPDDNAYEMPFEPGAKPVFPYNLPELTKKNGLGLIRTTPFGNSFTKDLAIEVIKSENLGKGPSPDFLAVSFSSTDYIGHQFGPRSVEVEDCYLRLDKDIAELLHFIDSWLGKDNVLIFLTADHGVSDVPAYLMDNKLPGGYIDGKLLTDSLKRFLNRNFGDTLIETIVNQQIYLDHKAMENKKIDPEVVGRKIMENFNGFTGVAGFYTPASLMAASDTDRVKVKLRNGYNASRSGDVLINYLPGWLEHPKTGTTHGSPYNYDTHVPLLWYGWKVKQGSSMEEVNITDIAPTLSIFLAIPAPKGSTGKAIPFLTK